MPTIPTKTTCDTLGCNERRANKSVHCSAHTRHTHNKPSKAYLERQALYDSRWYSFRTTRLSEHPLCQWCLLEGRYREATEVDHVIPHKGDSRLFWNNTFQCLCIEHHSTKTNLEMKGIIVDVIKHSDGYDLAIWVSEQMRTSGKT